MGAEMQLREDVLAYLRARPGEWVPVAGLMRLAPVTEVLCGEASGEETWFGHDDARGSAWIERQPVTAALHQVLAGLRGEQAVEHRFQPGSAVEEYRWASRE